jgi:hypothetical protein
MLVLPFMRNFLPSLSSKVLFALFIWPIFFNGVILNGKLVEYHLTIAEETVNKADKPVLGMTINGEIPGPTLFFEEGDVAKIQVTNDMDVPTSVHWHGLLLPNDMDGVPYLTYPPIAPGTTFTYEFPIRQTGTYWYHSHSNLQEQSGVYGSMAIYPKSTSELRGPKENELVVVLSDWTNQKPSAVMHTLKQGNEWFSIKKQSSQSLIGAIRLGMLGDYLERELRRMPPMDIADVGYDAFLLNGKQIIEWPAKPGERVRLRVIDASASSFFYLEYAGGPMTVVAADGQEVEPVEMDRLLISIAETYDVIVTVPESGAYEFRATSQDSSGYASLWIGSGKKHYAKSVPFPNSYVSHGASLKEVLAFTPAGSLGMPQSAIDSGEFDKPGMDAMGGMNHGAMSMEHGGTGHEQMEMETPMASMDASEQPPRIIQTPSPFDFLASDVSSHTNLGKENTPERPWPAYQKLRAPKSTAFDKALPVETYRLTLDGDMERYVWLINNRPLSPDDNIRIKEGTVARFVMINRTMMHHPMHLHGHFFRVINGQGDYSPLKHTVDVPPMSTVVIEFEADEFGDWFFHCHNLYHMHSGMARVVHYEGFKPDAATQAVRHTLYHDPYYLLGQAYLLTSMSSGFLQASNTFNIINAEWEYGFQNDDDEVWEVIGTYNRYINRFFSLFGGIDLVEERESGVTTRGIVGVNYLLPMNIDSSVWVDTDLGGRVTMVKSISLTPRLSLNGGFDYDTHLKWEGYLGMDFQLSKHFFLSGRWHSDYKWGVGAMVMF